MRFANRECQIRGRRRDYGGMSEPTAILLPVTSVELGVVLDALVRHAYACEADGDVLGDAPHADRVADRVRALQPLADAAIVQMLQHAGIGPHRHRPQG